VHKQEMKSFLLLFTAVLLVIVTIMFYIAQGTFPMRDIELGNTVLLFIPIVILSMFGILSRKIIKATQEGPSIIGWFAFILLSLGLGFVFNSSSLLSLRHVSFLLLVTSILFGIGLVHFHLIANPKDNIKRTVIISLIVFILLASMVPLSFPSQERAEGYEEGGEWEDVEAGFWLKSSTTRKTATDHRMSAAAFSTGYKNLTWTDGENMYFSSNYSLALQELQEHNVSYIMWDEEMLNGTATETGQNPRPLNPELKRSYNENLYRVYLTEECEVYVSE
ncbi:MAG: hypothetical protein V5A88_07460, partial [Candidatus Thermoplasmatota archaeon]